MVIFWKGKGILVPIALLLGGFVGHFIVGLIFQDGNDSKLYKIVGALIMFSCMAGANYLVTKLFVKDTQQVLVDQETGQEVILKKTSSFFFIPNRFWTFIMFGFCVLSIIITLFTNYQ